jgi:hypothetical protein
MGTEGPYDDLELTVAGGQLQITKAPTVPVSCMENGGAYRSRCPSSCGRAGSLDPWRRRARRQAGHRGQPARERGRAHHEFKVTGAAQEPGRVTGTLGISFSDSKYDVFSNTITFVNCAGSQSFEAVPAG